MLALPAERVGAAVGFKATEVELGVQFSFDFGLDACWSGFDGWLATCVPVLSSGLG